MRLLLVALLLGLSGCSAALSAGPGLVSGGIGSITSTLDAVDSGVDQEVLNRAARIHNLQIGLGQINGAAGMVVTVPTIVSPQVP